MPEIKITIITPVFNSINFIESCIKNVIDQNCASVEHLILDGGSTDGTTQVIEEYSKKYDHIKFFSEPDEGQSDAMNKGIGLAKGSIIGFLNADDGYYAHTLKRVKFLFESNSNLDFAVGNCKLVDLEGNMTYINRPQRLKPYHLFSYTEPFPINPVAYFYKKTIHDGVGLYNIDNHFNMDYEFILKAVLQHDLVYFNEDWGYAVHHDNAKTVMDTQANQLELRKMKVFEEIYPTIPFLEKIKSILYKSIKQVRK